MRLLIFLLIALVFSGCATVSSSANDDTAVSPVTGDALRGEGLFKYGNGGAPPCVSCHALSARGFSIGPIMAGIAERAGTRIPGLPSEDYLRQSILDPAAFVVSGYRPIMYPDYRQRLNDQEVADLIAYLSSL